MPLGLFRSHCLAVGSVCFWLGVASGWMLLQTAAADESPTVHPGSVVYREHCQACHGESGAGTKDVPQKLVGDRSVAQLANYIHDTMPEDDPSAVTGDAARHVAEYIHAGFYSAVAQDRNRPARVELSRLTVRQHQNTLADVIGSFCGHGPRVEEARGLRASYFHGRNFDVIQRVYDQIDPHVHFDFGFEGPDPERFVPNRFAIRWEGSIVGAETGTYELLIRTEHAARLWVNASGNETPLIDAWVKSGDSTEYSNSIFLLGGRAYRVKLDFSKANQGVDNTVHERPSRATIELCWKPPHGVWETVPNRCLFPQDSPPAFILKTPFPPDDRSIGYERGASVSKEWFTAATRAAGEAARYVVDHIQPMAHVQRDDPDRAKKLMQFAQLFAQRAFRRPLSSELESLVIHRPFADAPDVDTGLKRSILIVLNSPRFLFRESSGAADASDAAATVSFTTAARLSFGLWDSIPDQPLWDAAAQNHLVTVEQVAKQAERMVNDRRTRAKVRDFFFSWLRVEHGPEIVKDKTRYSEFSPEIAADLRTSFELFIDDAVWGHESEGRRSDFRRLFTDSEVPINGRLAPLYGVALPADAPFRRVRLDDGRRAGVLSHPYTMSILSYAGSTSPIHRGVFLARTVLGNVLKPPQEAVVPVADALHLESTTRQQVALQTSSVACQTCHTMINPLGFAMEEFDAIGRYRSTEKRGALESPIDASGSYQPRDGAEATFWGARELAASITATRDAQEAFVQNLFHALVKQPVRAWGPATLEQLRTSFEYSGFSVRRLLVDIMKVGAIPPQAPAVSIHTKSETTSQTQSQTDNQKTQTEAVVPQENKS